MAPGKNSSSDCPPRRGDIVFVRRGGPPPVGVEVTSGRPALVVSNNTMNGTAGFVHVVYLRRNISSRGPIHVSLGSIIDESDSVAACEQVTAVDKSRLGDLITVVSNEKMDEVDDALRYSLGLSA